jgi:CheY-like chemotaxis protein
LEAVEIIKNNPGEYEAVLMDIMMPEMDGYEAALHIKKLNNALPIIGQTAYCLDPDV